jgi:hypothetical protein
VGERKEFDQREHVRVPLRRRSSRRFAPSHRLCLLRGRLCSALTEQRAHRWLSGSVSCWCTGRCVRERAHQLFPIDRLSDAVSEALYKVEDQSSAARVASTQPRTCCTQQHDRCFRRSCRHCCRRCCYRGLGPSELAEYGLQSASIRGVADHGQVDLFSDNAAGNEG